MQWLSYALCGVLSASCVWAAKSLQAAVLLDRSSWPAEEEYVLLPPSKAARFTSLGYNELAADTTWVRALVYYGSSIEGDEAYRYLEKFIDNIMVLDPTFKRAFEWAVSAVTYREGFATQEEFRVSARYYEKAIKAFPDDWRLPWRAGLLYWFDLYDEDHDNNMKLKERGAELMERATRNPDAPDDLAGKASTMRTKIGQKERALSLLQEKLFTTDDAEARKALNRRFRKISGDERGDELQQVNQQFYALRADVFKHGHSDLFVLVGPRPSNTIDFDVLANERDLFGLEDQNEDEVDLFPWLPSALKKKNTNLRIKK